MAVDDAGGCAALAAGLLKRLGAAPEAGAAELVTPRLGNCDDPVPAPRLGKAVDPDGAVVVGAALAAGVLAGADAGGLPQPNELPLPGVAPAFDPAPAKRPVPEAADDAGVAKGPPRFREGVEPVEACPGADAAGVDPMLNPSGFAGFAEGVVLPIAPKSPGLGAVCPACAPGVAA